MKGEDFLSCLADEFRRVCQHRGRGTYAALQRELGLSGSYFSQWTVGGKVCVERLVDALDLLGIEPAEFISDACARHQDALAEKDRDGTDARIEEHLDRLEAQGD